MTTLAASRSGVEERAAAATGDTQEYLTLCLGDEEYGIDILRVREIRGYEHPTRIAGVPDLIRGVLNYRRAQRGGAHRGSNRRFGVDVIQLVRSQVKPAPEFNGAIDAAHITGLGTVRQGECERMLILQDIEKLMASTNIGLVEQGSPGDNP